MAVPNTETDQTCQGNEIEEKDQTSSADSDAKEVIRRSVETSLQRQKQAGLITKAYYFCLGLYYLTFGKITHPDHHIMATTMMNQ
jgi:hypothetical protein